MRYTNEQLADWKRPVSDTEERQINNTKRMIREAIKNHETLKNKNIELVIQGSYSNNTNIKQDSDVDICVMLKDTFYTEYRKDVNNNDYGFSSGTNSFNDFKIYVFEAIINKFGSDNVTLGNKSIQIHSTSYRVNADVVPAFQYRNYLNDYSNDPKNFIEGIKFLSKNGAEVVNYPKVHIKNGKDKNLKTLKRYKELVRIYKNIKKRMIANEENVPSSINSFLIESLLWNVPNNIFIDYPDWNDMLKKSISFLADESCKEWGEVSEYFYLFHSNRKWNREDVNNYFKVMWVFLEYPTK